MFILLDPQIPLLGIYLQIHSDRCKTGYARLLSAVLFIVRKDWKQPKYPSVGS